MTVIPLKHEIKKRSSIMMTLSLKEQAKYEYEREKHIKEQKKKCKDFSFPRSQFGK